MADKDRAPGQTVFSRLVHLSDASGAVQGRIEAADAERVALAQLFRIESLESFSFDYRLHPIHGERFELTGNISARLTQLCGVTLEPVAETVDEPVVVECWPQDQIALEDDTAEDPAIDGLPDDPPAPIVNNKLDVGALAAEILASAINPYPRKGGVEFDWQDPKTADGGGLGPFADLATLKGKR